VRTSLAAGILVALLAAGCSGRGAEEPPKADAASKTTSLPAKAGPKRDVAWLARLRRWELGFGRAAIRVGEVGRGLEQGEKTMRDLRHALRPIATCPQTLHRKVGEPRAARYSGSWDLLQRGCQISHRWALDLMDGVTTYERRRVENEMSRAEDLFSLAHDDLESSLVAHRELPTIGGKVTKSRVEPRLTRAVSRLVYGEASGTGVEVRCWSPKEWQVVRKEWGAYIGTGDFLGFAWGETGISLAPDVCAALVQLVYDRARPTSGTDFGRITVSVGILSHESQHLADTTASEAETECNGIQHIRRLAPMLGASADYAAVLAETYWAEAYPMNLPEYKTSACRDGGPLDRRPGTSVWP
jgi:hypothetical protein